MSSTALIVNHIASTGPKTVAMFNPFDSVVPNVTIFGAKFTSWWQKALGGIWALGLVFCACKLFPAAASLHQSRSAGNIGGVKEASSELKLWGVSAGATIAAGVLFGALIFAFGG